MDIDDIRRQNLRLLEKEFGGIRALANKVGMSYAQCLNYRTGVADSATGKIRGMRKETAWRFEDAFNKPRGWLDQDHDDASVSPAVKSLIDTATRIAQSGKLNDAQAAAMEQLLKAQEGSE